MADISKPKNRLFLGNIFPVWSVHCKLKLYFIGENLQCCIRNGFDNLEFVYTVSRVSWRTIQMSSHSTDVKQTSQKYTNTANLLKQFQTAKKLPKNFYSSLQAFLSSSSNPGKVFNNKKAKWHLSCKAHITKMNLLKMVSCKRKNATETVPVEPKKTR